jgi:hypothetical protein
MEENVYDNDELLLGTVVIREHTQEWVAFGVF